MSYLNRSNGYAPTGRTNSEPVPVRVSAVEIHPDGTRTPIGEPTYTTISRGALDHLDALEAADNPAFDLADGEVCPMCSAPTLATWRGGFADEPPAVPHSECRTCGATT